MYQIQVTFSHKVGSMGSHCGSVLLKHGLDPDLNCKYRSVFVKFLAPFMGEGLCILRYCLLQNINC